MLKTIHHSDGTIYKIERRANGKWQDLYFVYAFIKDNVNPFYSRVYATNPETAMQKARDHYAEFITA